MVINNPPNAFSVTTLPYKISISILVVFTPKIYVAKYC